MQVDVKNDRVYEQHTKLNSDQKFVVENPNKADTLNKSKSLMHDWHHVVVLQIFSLLAQNSIHPLFFTLFLKKKLFIHSANPN